MSSGDRVIFIKRPIYRAHYKYIHGYKVNISDMSKIHFPLSYRGFAESTFKIGNPESPKNVQPENHNCLFDTGAETNIIRNEILERLKIEPLQDIPPITHIGAKGQEILSYPYLATIFIEDRWFPFYCIPDNGLYLAPFHSLILGINFFTQHNVTFMYNNNEGRFSLEFLEVKTP